MNDIYNIFLIIVIIGFIITWIKIKFMMVVLDKKGNSFLYTILWVITKKDIQEFFSSK